MATSTTTLEPTEIQYPWFQLYIDAPPAATGTAAPSSTFERAVIGGYPSPAPSDNIYESMGGGPTDPRVTTLKISATDMPSAYHPASPSSMTSPYSPYPSSRARARSTSHFDPRASPASSSMSGLSSPHDLQHHRSLSSRPVHVPLHVDTNSPSITQLPRREKHTKHRLRDADRKAICLHHINNPHARQEDIGTHFGVERSTISKILKDKDKWLNITEQDEFNDQTAKHRPSKFPEIEEEMRLSLQIWSDNATNITDQLIRQRALEIAKTFHISSERFKGSSGWIENFKHRHEIRRGEWLRGNKLQPQLSLPSAQTPFSAPMPPPVIDQHQHDQHQQIHGAPSTRGSPISNGSCEVVPSSPWAHRPHLSPPAQDQSHEGSMALDPSLQDHPSSSSSSSSSHDHNDNHLHQQHAMHQHSPHTSLPHAHNQSSIQQSPEQSPPAYMYSHPHQHAHQLYGPGVVPHTGHTHTVPLPMPISTHALPLQHHTIPIPIPNEHPTVQQAEDALNTVITFFDSGGQGILKGREREVLQDIKHALFQYASGVPYERSP